MNERFSIYLRDIDFRDNRFSRWVGRCAVANGCFDVLHPGHLSLLAHLDTIAYQNALIPIVAINSDKSIKRLKGPSRPVVPELARAALINNLKWSFSVIIFDEETPWLLMELLEPKIVVKGSQYSRDEIIKHKDSRVELVDMLGEWSTTRIVGDTR